MEVTHQLVIVMLWNDVPRHPSFLTVNMNVDNNTVFLPTAVFSWSIWSRGENITRQREESIDGRQPSSASQKFLSVASVQ
jgi:hypothetical protein